MIYYNDDYVPFYVSYMHVHYLISLRLLFMYIEQRGWYPCLRTVGNSSKNIGDDLGREGIVVSENSR